MRYSVLVGVVGVVFSGAVWGQFAEKAGTLAPGVTVGSISIKRAVDHRETEDLFFGGFDGTRIAVLVHRPEKNMVGLDRKGSKLTRFGDDAGTDFLKGDGQDFFSFPHFSKDGHYASLDLASAKLPAGKATKIVIQGSLAVRCGADEKKETVEKVAMKTGSTFKVGGIGITIASVEKPKLGDAALWVTLQARDSMDAIRSLRFLDGEGKEIQSDYRGGGRMTMGTKVTVESRYTLERKVDSATLEVTYWGTMETIEVPVDVKVGVGL